MRWSMAARTEAYVDTSALVAFADRSDSHHDLFRRLFSRPPSLVTTPLVVAEGHGWFLRRFNCSRALAFLAMIEAMPVPIASVGPAEQSAGVALLRRFADQDLTLVDAVGLEVMAAWRCAVCWSTDFHLGLTGVPLAIERG
jgi:predicted nucleic acid-binding protein